MAAPNPNENGETTPGTNDHPGVLSKLSNTIQAIKMPWNKDEQGAAPSAEDANAPLDAGSAPNAAEGQAGSNVFSATMSKVSNTFSGIQMPWTNKDQPAPVPPAGDASAPAPAAGVQPGSDTNVLTDAFSKVTNTISNIQMPWTNKNEPQKTETAPEPAADLGAQQAQTAADNVLTSTFSKVTNTFSNMQMPWSSKGGDQSATQHSPPVEGEQTQVNGVGQGQPTETPLDKVTGFFTSVFKPGSAQPSESGIAENANTDGENSSKAQ